MADTEDAHVGFYMPIDTARLARVPRHRLTAWRHQSIVFPTLTFIDFNGRESEGYTFEAVVYLRLLRLLRDRNISLYKAVSTLKQLRDHFGPPGPNWEQARILVQGGSVFAESKDHRKPLGATRGDRKTVQILFDKEFAQLRDRADALLVPTEFQPFVQVDPAIRSGHPVVRGTTLPTAILHAMRQQGESTRAIRAAYPHLSPAQIRGALSYELFLDHATE